MDKMIYINLFYDFLKIKFCSTVNQNDVSVFVKKTKGIFGMFVKKVCIWLMVYTYLFNVDLLLLCNEYLNNIKDMRTIL